MKTHFTTVPIDIAVQAARPGLDPPLPLALVVDDEVLIVETLVSILNRNGLATMPATNGDSAMELVRLAPPDVLITDVKMPEMDGFELAMKVSKAAPDCNIILLSGEPSSFNEAAEFRAQGFDFVLMMKPAHPTDLLACAYEMLAMRGWLVPEGIPRRDANLSDLILMGSISADPAGRADQRGKALG